MPELIAIAPVRKIVMDTLVNDSGLFPTPFSGGVLNRVPQAGKGDHTTPQAYYDNSVPQEAGKLKPTIAVITSGDVPSPNGAAINGFDGFLSVHGYVPVSTVKGVPELAAWQGDDMLARLERIMRTYFDGHKQYPLGNGGGVQVKVLELLGVFDADELGYAGRQRGMWRLQGTYIRA